MRQQKKKLSLISVLSQFVINVAFCNDYRIL